MSEYLMAGSALLACLAAGTMGVQGVQTVRCRAWSLNAAVPAVAIASAVASAVLFALTLRSPLAFFTALRHGTSGIAVYLYTTLAFAVAGAAAFVMARRSEGAGLPRWAGFALVALALSLVFGTSLGFLKSALAKTDARCAVLFALLAALSLCLGAFFQIVMDVVRSKGEACDFGRPLCLVGAISLAAASALFAGWFLAGSDAAAGGAARAAFSFDGFTANMGTAAAATAAGRLSAVAERTILFWGGAVACGDVLPIACAAGVVAKGSGKTLRNVCAVAGLGAALVGGYCLCLVVGLLL